MIKNSDSDIEEVYIKAAKDHLDLLLARDVNGSNRAHDHLIAAARVLRGRLDFGKEFHERAIMHEHESVRNWAALHMLPLDGDRAIEEFERLAVSALHWQTRSSAKTTLAEWRAARLDPDWFMKEKP